MNDLSILIVFLILVISPFVIYKCIKELIHETKKN